MIDLGLKTWIAGFLFVLLVISPIGTWCSGQPRAVAQTVSVWTDQQVYTVGQTVTVYFSPPVADYSAHSSWCVSQSLSFEGPHSFGIDLRQYPPGTSSIVLGQADASDVGTWKVTYFPFSGDLRDENGHCYQIEFGPLPVTYFEVRSGQPPSSTVSVTFVAVDAATGSRISGASVWVDGSYAGSTGSDGVLTTSASYPPSDHNYRISANGYESESGSFSVGSNGGGTYTVQLRHQQSACPDGQYWTGSQCTCPSGQDWNGQQCVTPPPTCSVRERSITVTRIEQEQTNPGDCWDASSLMLLKFYGTYRPFPSQLEFARQVAGPILGDHFYKEGIWSWLETSRFGSWSAALMYYGLLEGTWTRSISFDEVVADINANRPIMVTYLVESGILATKLHTVVISGYKIDDCSGDQYISLVDPSPYYPDPMGAYWSTYSRIIEYVFRTKPRAVEGTVITLQEQAQKLYLHVYDSKGRHVGINHQTQSVELGIPGAEYFDFGESIMIIIPPEIVEYKYTVDATSAEQTQENYEVTVSSIKDNSLVSETHKQDVIGQNEIKEYAVNAGHFTATSSDLGISTVIVVAALAAIAVIVAVAVVLVHRRSAADRRDDTMRFAYAPRGPARLEGSRPRVKEIRSTAGGPRATGPRVLKVEDE